METSQRYPVNQLDWLLDDLVMRVPHLTRAVFLSQDGLALGASYIWPDTIGAKDLRIPVAGPWISFAHSGCGPVADCHEEIVVLRAIATAFDGVGQIGGLLIAGQGLFLPTQEPKREHGWKPFRDYAVEMQPTLDAGKNTVGFGVAGVF